MDSSFWNYFQNQHFIYIEPLMKSEIFNRSISEKLKIFICCWCHAAVADDTVPNSSGFSIRWTHSLELDTGLNEPWKINRIIYCRIFKAIYSSLIPPPSLWTIHFCFKWWVNRLRSEITFYGVTPTPLNINRNTLFFWLACFTF